MRGALVEVPHRVPIQRLCQQLPIRGLDMSRLLCYCLCECVLGAEVCLFRSADAGKELQDDAGAGI